MAILRPLSPAHRREFRVGTDKPVLFGAARNPDRPHGAMLLFPSRRNAGTEAIREKQYPLLVIFCGFMI